MMAKPMKTLDLRYPITSLNKQRSLETGIRNLRPNEAYVSVN